MDKNWTWGWNDDTCAVWGQAIILGEKNEKAKKAALISSAPDMFEALNNFPDDFDFANADDFRKAVNQWWDEKALPAIERAEGKNG